MERRTAREWKSIVCPECKGQSLVMSEWDILSEEGRLLRKTLKQIDCHSSRLAEFGRADCSWACEKAIAKEVPTRPRMDLMWVCAVFVGAMLWMVFYNLSLRSHLHPYGVAVFFGLPLLIGLMVYYTWKIMGPRDSLGKSSSTPGSTYDHR